ncbi:MAG TPA: hypothetical protein P5137_16690, partial [Candidatus Brocadiia bacterium]|nr:hypothetical protein [Candidatus Brocadiia bacterium]
DPKLWVALSCPVRNIEFDARTLDLLDTDHDGRIRRPEVIAATQWTARVLRDSSQIIKESPELPLDTIDERNDEGRAIIESARQILESLGKPGATTISVADASDTVRILSQTRFNGDGVITASSAADPETQQIIADIIACYGPKTDRGGQPGVDQPAIDQFFTDLRACAAWWDMAEASEQRDALFPLGDKTQPAWEAIQAVRPKIDDFFARAQLAAFDERAAAKLNASDSDLAALAPKDLSKAAQDIAALPLARVAPSAPLPLQAGLKPPWAPAVTRLNTEVITPLLGPGKTALTQTEWRSILARFEPFEKWFASKPASAVEKLGLPRIRQILASPARATLAELIQNDLAAAPRINAIEAVERLARFNRDIYTLINNFVTFADFYSRDRLATFQAGTLYLDGRSCELAIIITDVAKHSAIAALSKCFLVYCECTRKDSPEKRLICAAMTAGDSDYLIPGRNGVFVDRQGRDWDATIVKIVDNPISLKQAFWAPYKRIGRMFGEQIERIVSSVEKEVAGASAIQVPTGPAAKPVAPFDIAKMAGVFAAIGLAVGAIGTAIATIASRFVQLQWWQMPLVLLAALLLVSGPSVIIAWIKLRQRTLGPILDAAGWAVNGRVKITFRLGRVLTEVATLPPKSARSLDDPYEETSHFNWRRILAALVLAGAVAVGAWFTHRHFYPPPPP